MSIVDKKLWCTIEEVEQALSDEKSVVVDIRNNDCYAGWTIEKMGRGGHIPGALDCHALRDGSFDKIILYGMEEGKLLRKREELLSRGCEHVRLFNLEKWFESPNMEWETYPHYEYYVPAEIVHQIVEGKYPAEIPTKKKLRIIYVGWGNKEETGYMDGHVPGAVYMNSDEFEPPGAYVSDISEWRLGTVELLGQLLNEYGIDKDTVVIVTGEDVSAACRFAVICKHMGMESVYVMSRGYKGWKEAGFPLETSAKEKDPNKVKQEFESDKMKWILYTEDVKENLDNPAYEWVDIREWDEYMGKTSGYDYHFIAGTIRGAKFGNSRSGDGTYMSTFRNPDMSMKNPKVIRKMWTENHIDMQKKMAFFCGGGWRAAEVLWDALVMGIENAAILGDGWIAWSNEGHPCDHLQIYKS